MFSGVGWRFWAGLARPSCGSRPDNTPGLSACRHHYWQAQLRALTPHSYATHPTRPSNRTVYIQGYVFLFFFFLFFFFYLRPLGMFLIHLLLSIIISAHTTMSKSLWVCCRLTLRKIKNEIDNKINLYLATLSTDNLQELRSLICKYFYYFVLHSFSHLKELQTQI